MKTKPPCSFQIRQGSKFSVERHLKSKKHKNCMKASDSFQLNKNYYAEIFPSAENKIEKMTENVIRVVYYVVQENLAMLKTESLYNLLDKCEAAVGNQLHSRMTAASITKSIDHVFMQKLTRFLASEECEEFMTIADEMRHFGPEDTDHEVPFFRRVGFARNGRHNRRKYRNQ